MEYLLKEDRFHCPPDHYEVCPLQFLQIISDRSKTKSSYQYGQELSLRFLAPQIPGVIYAQFYSGLKRRGKKDNGFLGKINGEFICLTAAILCHALCCWVSGSFVDDVNFTRSSSQGTDKKRPLETGDHQADGKTGLLERQLQTWGNTPELFQTRIIGRIKRSVEERIAKDGKTRVERTDGYSNNLDALHREFGIDPEGAGSQYVDVGRGQTPRGYSHRGSQREEEQDPFTGLIDLALVYVHANSEDQVEHEDG